MDIRVGWLDIRVVVVVVELRGVGGHARRHPHALTGTHMMYEHRTMHARACTLPYTNACTCTHTHMLHACRSHAGHARAHVCTYTHKLYVCRSRTCMHMHIHTACTCMHMHLHTHAHTCQPRTCTCMHIRDIRTYICYICYTCCLPAGHPRGRASHGLLW